MKIQTLIDNNNSRYQVYFDILSFTAQEEELMNQFGEPILNVGGYFKGEAKRDSSSPYIMVEFTLPTKHRRIDLDFPISQIFDLNDDINADVKAYVYANELRSRIQAVKNTLLQNSSPFIGETINTI